MGISYIDRMILSSFTSLEKQAFYQLLCGAMVIDGDRDPREKAVIEHAMELVGLTEQERQASRQTSTQSQIATLKAMDNSKKMYLGKYMSQVILADGVLTPKEHGWFNFMLDLLDIPELD